MNIKSGTWVGNLNKNFAPVGREFEQIRINQSLKVQMPGSFLGVDVESSD